MNKSEAVMWLARGRMGLKVGDVQLQVLEGGLVVDVGEEYLSPEEVKDMIVNKNFDME